MLRVGLTGELGSGKSTVAAMLAARGAHVFSSDDMGRALMQPGQPVFAQIIQTFGESVVTRDGALDRKALAQLAFGGKRSDSRVEELNAIVHPAVLAAQSEALAQLAVTEPNAIAVIESALIFSTKHGGPSGWDDRFQRIVLITAPHAVKLERFIARATAGRAITADERAALVIDAERRMAAQRITPAQAEDCIVLRNSGDVAALEARVDELWRNLLRWRDVS